MSVSNFPLVLKVVQSFSDEIIVFALSSILFFILKKNI